MPPFSTSQQILVGHAPRGFAHECATGHRDNTVLAGAAPRSNGGLPSIAAMNIHERIRVPASVTKNAVCHLDPPNTELNRGQHGAEFLQQDDGISGYRGADQISSLAIPQHLERYPLLTADSPALSRIDRQINPVLLQFEDSS